MSTITQQLPVFDRRKGAGPTLVLLHYWGGSARTWAPMLERLPDRAAVALDLRGWSRSRQLDGPFGLTQLAADVLAVIDHLGLQEYVLVGHSMGGKVAQLVGASRPEGLVGLVLVASGPSMPAAAITPEYQEGLSHAYDSAETVAHARDEILTALPLSEDLRTQILEDSLASAPEARTVWPLVGIAEDIREAAGRIAVPALVVGAEHDVVEPVEVLREGLLPYLADTRMTVVGGSGHLVPLEAPEALAALVEEFVASLA